MLSGRAGGGRAALSWLTFWLIFLQIRFSRKVFNLRASNFIHGFSGSLRSCDAKIFSFGSQLFGENAFFGDRYFYIYFFFHKFLCIFHNSKTIQGIWMDLYRVVDPDNQARCTQVT